MSGPEIQIFLFSAIAGFCVWFWSRIWQKRLTDGGGEVNAGGFNARDLLPCAILLSWYLLVTTSSILAADSEKVVSLDPSILLFNLFISVVLLAIVWGSASRDGRSPFEMFGLKRLGAIKIAGLSIGLICMTLPLIHVASILMQTLGAEAGEQELVTYFRQTASVFDRWFIAITAVIVAPVVEEFVFRGFFYGFLKRCSGSLVAMLLSSALFAMVHGFVPALLPLFLLAVCLVLAYEYSGSLWVPIGMHAMFNLGTILYLFHAGAETTANL